MDVPVRATPLERRLRRLAPGERREEAEAFLRRFCRETGRGESYRRRRWAEISRALRRHGHYEHEPEELAFGARVAWRNHARCIGRLPWETLEVVDCRGVRDADAVAGHIVEHLAGVFDGGRIRSRITIFAPHRPGEAPVYVESPQIVQYAGYDLDGGGTLGDPHSIELTRIARSLGWEPPAQRSGFDVLPFILRTEAGGRALYEVPGEALREVAIIHPEIAAIGALGLRWYTVPMVSDMVLTIGGIDYPCAPFNGYYMGTEIASRNFGDERRYGLLPDVARAMGLEPGPDASLWKDRALTELNRAVLHSFAASSVTMIDHHAASRQYMLFERRERSSGRTPSGFWAWIVPPQASSACPVFHAGMRDMRAVPNFYRSRATDGAGLRPDRGDEERSRLRLRLDRWRRDWYRWRRERLDR